MDDGKNDEACGALVKSVQNPSRNVENEVNDAADNPFRLNVSNGDEGGVEGEKKREKKRDCEEKEDVWDGPEEGERVTI